MARVAINGLGRIGRCTFKQALGHSDLELVAVNDLVPPEQLAYLLKYDTVYGRYDKYVSAAAEDSLVVEGTGVRCLSEKDPAQLPWGTLGVDLVFECTGGFDKKEQLEGHLKAGAGRVILSAPAKSDEIPTVVHGVNVPPKETDAIISCASCTTNCITPIVEVVGRRIGLKKATMTTIHAYTGTQAIVDGPDKKIRRGRAGAANVVPSSTGAAKATTKALPSCEGRFDGVAVRAPIPVGSLADVVMVTARPTSVEEVNEIFREEAAGDRYRGILEVTEDPIVSSDVIKETYAAIVDLGLTQVVDGDLVKIMGWYDNEWGYASQMVREARRLVKS